MTNEAKLRATVDALLQQSHVVTLAFADAQGPWSVPVYYYLDESRLIFASSVNSRHVAAIAAGLPFSASIHRDSDNWKQILGLQMEGEITPASREQQEAWQQRFLSDLPLAGATSELVSIAARLSFHSFAPRRIVLTDNSVRLGFRWEMQLP